MRELKNELMDGSGMSHSFYFIDALYESAIGLIRYPYVFRLLIFPNKANALITKCWGNILPAHPPLASSPIRTTYWVEYGSLPTLFPLQLL